MKGRQDGKSGIGPTTVPAHPVALLGGYLPLLGIIGIFHILPGHIGDSRHGLVHHIGIGLATVRLGSVLTISVDGAVDEIGLYLLELAIPNAPLVHLTGLEGLNDHVYAVVYKSLQKFPALFRLQVEGDVELVTPLVDICQPLPFMGETKGRIGPGRISPRGFHPDDIGPHLGQDGGGEATAHVGIAQIQHPDIVQGLWLGPGVFGIVVFPYPLIPRFGFVHHLPPPLS